MRRHGVETRSCGDGIRWGTVLLALTLAAVGCGGGGGEASAFWGIKEGVPVKREDALFI